MRWHKNTWKSGQETQDCAQASKPITMLDEMDALTTQAVDDWKLAPRSERFSYVSFCLSSVDMQCQGWSLSHLVGGNA
jgi:collagenase-like PrtC family protease